MSEGGPSDHIFAAAGSMQAGGEVFPINTRGSVLTLPPRLRLSGVPAWPLVAAMHRSRLCAPAPA